MGQSNVETIYLVHHSHTDVGYTHDQPVVWDLQRRFLDAAIDLCQREAERGDDGAFRWTVESTAVLEYWLRHSQDRQVARFLDLARAGRIEVTAMFANLTPLCDTEQLASSFRFLRTIRDELGLPVTSAMNSDVNGENWPLVDILLDLGIRGFSMAINPHFGGALEPHPLPFFWQGPSGRKLLAWNGFSYGQARALGIGRDATQFAQEWWPRVDSWLAQINYPLPGLMLQIIHPFGDNGSADPALGDFVRAWNQTGQVPRLRIALPREWWQLVSEHADRLPTLRGDWTDYWNFGCASTAREVAINRASRSRLFAADAAWACVSGLGGEADPTRRPPAGLRTAASRALTLFDEHTWGADCAIRRPDDEDTTTQWHHKAAYAYTARSQSLLLARDGVAELARRIARDEDDRLLIFNPLSWERTVAGLVADPEPAVQRGTADDPTASRHFLDRSLPRRPVVLSPTRVPAFGYTLVRSSEVSAENLDVGEEAVVANHRHRLTFDRERGGVVAWLDQTLGRDLIDREADWPGHGFVHERVAGADHPWPRRLIFDRPQVDLPPHRGWQRDWPAERQCPLRVVEHRVERSNVGIRVMQRLEAPGVRNLVQEVFLPTYADHVEFRSSWQMSAETAPEATYLTFPFAIPGARVRLDLGGQAIEPEEDQLPGACRDYFTVQRWVDFSNGDFGVTIACPTTPMVQLGGFAFGRKQSRFQLGRALLLGWPTNNYWETNFAASQPGLVSARYVVLPHAGPFSEAAAHRFGLEFAVAPLFQHLGEQPIPGAIQSRGGSLLQLPAAPILTLSVAPSDLGEGVVLHLLNSSDAPVNAEIGSGLLHIRAAKRCDLLEHPLEELPLRRDVLALELPPRRLACLRLDLVNANAEWVR